MYYSEEKHNKKEKAIKLKLRLIAENGITFMVTPTGFKPVTF